MPIKSLGRSLFRNQSGMAAVEFALILPVMVLMFFGAIEVSNLLLADNKLRAAASGAADLVTQDSDGTITEAELIQVTAAVTEIMRPMVVTPARLSLVVTDFRVTPVSKVINVVWSRMLRPTMLPAPKGNVGVNGMEAANCSNSSGNDGAGNPIELPPALSIDSAGNAVTNDIVRVDAVYTWIPWFSVVFSSGINLHAVNYFMPRYSIALAPGTGMSPPC